MSYIFFPLSFLPATVTGEENKSLAKGKQNEPVICHAFHQLTPHVLELILWHLTNSIPLIESCCVFISLVRIEDFSTENMEVNQKVKFISSSIRHIDPFSTPIFEEMKKVKEMLVLSLMELHEMLKLQLQTSILK